MARAISSKTAVGVCRMIQDGSGRFGLDGFYWHVVVDSGGRLRHLVLTEQQYAEGLARAERGLDELPEVPWYRRFGAFWWTLLNK